MRRTSLTEAVCPISRCVDQVGDWWSILILRNALLGHRRFDEFQQAIGLATNMLSRRLKSLVEAGLLERHPYQQRPARYEYRLTDKGRDFVPVLVTMAAWGNRWLAADDTYRVVAADTGAPVDAVLIDRNTGRPIDADGIRVVRTPAAAADPDTPTKD